MLLSPPPPPPEFAGEASRAPQASPGTGARIWLVRHGRVVSPTVAYGDEDVELSEEGAAQALDVAESFVSMNVVAVASSPLSRALAMGRAVAERTGAALEIDGRLREMNRGAWQGLERQEYQNRWRNCREDYWSNPLDWAPENGESEREVAARGIAALIDLVQAAGGGLGVVTAHRQLIRATVACALGLPPGRSHAMVLDPGHGVLLADTEGRWTLERTNVANPSAAHAAEPSDGPPGDVDVGHSPRP